MAALPDPPAPLAAWLRAQRDAHDLSRPQLALVLGISPETIRALERGLRRPSRQLATALFDYFQVAEADRVALLPPLAPRLPRLGEAPTAGSASAAPASPAGAAPEPAAAPEPTATPDPAAAPEPTAVPEPAAAPAPPRAAATVAPPPVVLGPVLRRADLVAVLDAALAAQTRALERLLTTQLHQVLQQWLDTQLTPWITGALVEERALIQQEQRDWDRYLEQRRRGRRAAWTVAALIIIEGLMLGMAPEPAMLLTLAVFFPLTVGLAGGPWVTLQEMEGQSTLTAILILTLWGLIGLGLVAVLVWAWQRRLPLDLLR